MEPSFTQILHGLKEWFFWLITMTENESLVMTITNIKVQKCMRIKFGSKGLFYTAWYCRIFLIHCLDFFSWSRTIVSSMALLMKAVVLSSIEAACSWTVVLCQGVMRTFTSTNLLLYFALASLRAWVNFLPVFFSSLIYFISQSARWGAIFQIEYNTKMDIRPCIFRMDMRLCRVISSN